MNKYTCFFLNQHVEDLYQQNHQVQQRLFQFKLFTNSLFVGVTYKLIMMLISGNTNNLYPHISMLIILLMYYIVKIENGLKLRITQATINLFFTFYVLQNDVFTDNISQNFNGGNQATANILNSMMGEFPDAALGTMATLAMRFYFFFRYGDLNNLSVMFITTLLHFVWIYYLYNFNKAKRSQFITTLVDNKWEKIFQQILNNNQKFLLIHYDDDDFKIKKVLQTILPSSSTFNDIFEYIRQAKVYDEPIQNFFYQQINLFKKTQQDVVNQQILVKYQNKLIQFNFSLFFGDKPIILLVKEDQVGLKVSALNQQTIILKLFKHLINIIQSQKKYNKQKFFQLSLFIQIKYLLGKFNTQQKSIKQINLIDYINKIAGKYKSYLIIQTQGLECQINTQANIFHLYLLIIFGNTNNKCISVQIYRDLDFKVHLAFEGYFKQDTINLLYKKFEFYFALIIRNSSIKQNCIMIELNDEILSPFINSEIQFF